MEKVDIKSMTLSKLEEFCTGQGLAKFRCRADFSVDAPKTGGFL